MPPIIPAMAANRASAPTNCMIPTVRSCSASFDWTGNNSPGEQVEGLRGGAMGEAPAADQRPRRRSPSRRYSECAAAVAYRRSSLWGAMTTGSAGSPGPKQRRSWMLYALGLVVVGHVMFSPALGIPLLGDDYNEISKSLLGPSRDGWFHAGEGVSFLRPLFSASLALNHSIGGLDPVGYHALNVSLHVVNSLLVATATAALAVRAGRVDPSDSPGPMLLMGLPMIAGAVFLLSGSHGEPIYWVSARADLLATSFSLISIVTFMQSSGLTGRRRRVSVALSLLAFTAALLSKESVVAIPAVLTTVALLVARDDSGHRLAPSQAVLTVSPHFAVLGGYFVLRWWILGTPIGGYGLEGTVDAGAVNLIGHYVVSAARTVVPAAPPAIWIGFAAAGAVAVIGAAVVARVHPEVRREWFRAVRAWPLSSVSVMLASSLFVTLIPAAVVGASAFNASGERVIYLPSVFAASLIAVALVGLSRRHVHLIAACVVLATAATAVNLREARRWNDAGTAAEAVSTKLAEHVDGSTRYLINSPDNVRGAVAFRNSAAGLDWLQAPSHRRSTVILASVTLDSPFDEFVVGYELTAGRWTAWVESNDADLAGPRTPADDGDWTVRIVGPNRYEVDLPADVDPSNVWYLSKGELLRLAGGTDR
jgi:hypothetical protein